MASFIVMTTYLTTVWDSDPPGEKVRRSGGQEPGALPLRVQVTQLVFINDINMETSAVSTHTHALLHEHINTII